MKLTILTPLHETENHVAWLEIWTDTGNLVIQKGHAPTILVLKEHSELTFRLHNGKQEVVPVPRGIAEIKRDEVVVAIQAVA